MELRSRRPDNIKTPMDRLQRAKQFAPYEALGSMEAVMKAVDENRTIEDIEHIVNLEDFECICAEDMDEDLRLE